MKNQLNALAAALSLGTLFGICLFLCTLLALKTGIGTKWLELFSDFYPWYQITTVGAIWGLVWGFLDAFIGTYLAVTLYNFFSQKLGK